MEEEEAKPDAGRPLRTLQDDCANRFDNAGSIRRKPDPIRVSVSRRADFDKHLSYS
jgi:hypothetical protein